MPKSVIFASPLASTTAAAQPTAATPAKLKAVAQSLGHSIYWVGPKPGYTYELTKTDSGQIYIRYLPAGVAIGSKKPYLTVATYPYASAFQTMTTLGGQHGMKSIKLHGGGLAVVDPNHPESIHLAFPDSDVQVEVFDPSGAAARRLVSSGKVEALG